MDAARQRDVVDAVQALNDLQAPLTRDPEIATRIAQYEMAFKMQSSVPDLMDLTNEPAEALDLYGCKPGDGSFASNCLLARRLAERGVRFIQLYHRGWDHHNGLVDYMQNHCGPSVDRALPDCSPISSAKACLRIRLIVGAANSAARRWPSATRAPWVVIIT